MKMRWRVLTREQLESGDVRGAVTIGRTAHYSEHAVLEFQPDEQTQKDYWSQIPLYFPGREVKS
jgi:hypothetical protein